MQHAMSPKENTGSDQRFQKRIIESSVINFKGERHEKVFEPGR
jgi:hypothetical protein